MSCVSMVANARTWPQAAWSSGQRSSSALSRGLLVSGQGIRMAGEPAADLPDTRWWREERRCGEAVLVKGVTDGGIAAGVAERADLPEQPGYVAAAFRRALVQMGLERVQHAGARRLPAAIDKLLPGGGAGVALHGVPSPAQMPGDGPDPVPFSQQLVHHRVVPPGSLGELPGRFRLPLWPGYWRGRRGFWFSRGLGLRSGQAGAVRGDAPFDRLGEVLPQVEPVSDLDRVRRPGPCTVGVGARVVPADHLDAGMGRPASPRGVPRRGLPAGQEGRRSGSRSAQCRSSGRA